MLSFFLFIYYCIDLFFIFDKLIILLLIKRGIHEKKENTKFG